MRFLFLILFFSTLSSAKTVKYSLSISHKTVNLSGKKLVDFALAVNDSIPAPTLEFTEGDDAEITVSNNLSTHEEVSIHWHGILLPPEEDGVAYINTPPIHKGQSRTFKFKIRQHGTYWYHSHTKLQEQKGVYGAFVIHPKKRVISYNKEAVLVLSDWTDENPDQVLKNLRKDGDFYLSKKKSVRSIWGALTNGGISNFFENEWDRMGGMDLSDVGYDAFLINGKQDSQLLTAQEGDAIRLRIINAGASSYFYVSLAGLPMNVVSADGIDIKPIKTQEILMGMAETYDVLFTLPENKNFELRATAQDVTGYASSWVGAGEKLYALDKATPDLYSAMDHSSDHSLEHSLMNHGAENVEKSGTVDHSKMDHGNPATKSEVLNLLTVNNLRSQTSTKFPDSRPIQEVKLVLGGDMERYVWHINGKAIHEDKLIEVNENQILRFTFENQTMMHHPMHLHGHFFRVLNKENDFSPLKHTVDVEPHSSRTIEFFTNEPGQWMLHCHNLYHMKSGMARVVKYSTWQPSSEMKIHEKHDHHQHDPWYYYGNFLLTTRVGEAKLRSSQTWNQFDFRVEAENKSTSTLGFSDGYEYQADLEYRRWMGQFFNLSLGGTLIDKRLYGIAGFSLTLPLLIESNFSISHSGFLKISFEKKLQWTSQVFSNLELQWISNQEESTDYKISLMYALNWNGAAGLIITDKKIGAGINYRF